MERRFFVGLDLGQAQDPSALTVLERATVEGEWDAAMFAHRTSTELRLRHAERIRLGTPYPEVVARVGEVTRSAELRGRCQLIVDASGVGRPVVDMVRAARLECSLLAVVITSGGSESYAANYYHVPKRDLVAGVQLALQNKVLQVAARMKGAAVLREEMQEMRVRVSSTGHETFGAMRQGTHDDLVVALALSVWGMRKAYPKCLGGEAGWRGREAGWRGGG